MKKQLIIAFALCALFLSACGSALGTSTLASSSASHAAAPVATASAQTVCQVLHARQAQLNQKYQAASAQLATALAQGNRQQVGEAEHWLIRLHQAITQVQVQLNAC